MQIQFSTTETCASQLLSTGLMFETVPPAGTKLDPPDNQGGGGLPVPSTEPAPEEEESEPEAD